MLYRIHTHLRAQEILVMSPNRLGPGQQQGLHRKGGGSTSSSLAASDIDVGLFAR